MDPEFCRTLELANKNTNTLPFLFFFNALAQVKDQVTLLVRFTTKITFFKFYSTFPYQFQGFSLALIMRYVD